MQTAGGINNHVVDVARFGGGERVKENGGRIGAGFGLDDFHASTLPPNFKLLNGGGTEGIRSA